MKTDIRNLRDRMRTSGMKPGELVLTAEIHRLLRYEWHWSGPHNDRRRRRVAIVVPVFPQCEACGRKQCVHERVMELASREAGQQSVMQLKAERQPRLIYDHTSREHNP